MTTPNRITRRLLSWIGSLWLAAVLLVLVLVALACATVFESMHGTEQALSVFYHSPWFAWLLGLLSLNVLAAVLARWPLPRNKWPFALTHLSLLVILAGALVTKFIGIEGQMALSEGSASSTVTVRAPRITIEGLQPQHPTTIDLPVSLERATKPVESLPEASATEGGVTVSVLRYMPDSRIAIEVTNDNPRPHRAVELALSTPDSEHTAWLFPGEPVSLGAQSAVLRVFADQASLEQFLNEALQPPSIGTVRATLDGQTAAWPIEECRAAPVPFGATGLTLRVTDYYPHANVGSGGALHSASDRPENPAIRVVLDGPQGSFERLAFAKFPDFSMRRPDPEEPDIKIAFEFKAGQHAAHAPIEVFAAPAGPAYVRFAHGTNPTGVQPLEPGRSMETPWAGVRLAVRQSFDHAQRREVLVPLESWRETRNPGVLVAVQDGAQREELWLQKYQPRRLTLGGRQLEVRFEDQQLELGFKVALDDFTIRYYPGTRRPRSFESRITITDPNGDSTTRLVSMNRPVKHNGLSFFQSSYQGETMSILSVSRDPGLPIVFAGYFGLMTGMICVLITRVRSSAAARSSAQAQQHRRTPVNINLLVTTDRCLNEAPLPAGDYHAANGAPASSAMPMRNNRKDRVQT